MSLKSAASLNNRSIIKTEVSIPRDSVIIDNSEIFCNEPSISAVNYDEE